ncbi:hypothetical protein PENTCL1PPCAC_13849 [Pristionchus entomophagus]|uniref:Uncharacterized protein n=1 Tax=Pristionchus entomophagus TaxID=358040 RepID=A0AAV5TEY4_9BILA|nr:hypothetical protein PENTCL1PPCAC_13849 [Pristionchus entomophagus]
MSTTPETEERFKAASEMIRAFPTHLNDSHARLNPQAQSYFNQIREIVKTEQDMGQMRAKIEAIRAPLSADIIKELDQQRKDLVEGK